MKKKIKSFSVEGSFLAERLLQNFFPCGLLRNYSSRNPENIFWSQLQIKLRKKSIYWLASLASKATVSLQILQNIFRTMHNWSKATRLEGWRCNTSSNTCLLKILIRFPANFNMSATNYNRFNPIFVLQHICFYSLNIKNIFKPML